MNIIEPDICNLAIENDIMLHFGIGGCGMEGQSMPVGVGKPMLRLEKMAAGGIA
ncbi:hypothetical protein [Paraburkholderia sp.]|uniref:hypothetical protein n=1 Tax=Paraburkholderia sp. TaxID=1926495 RepID=UPI003D6E535C